jgi:hypothetical protein
MKVSALRLQVVSLEAIVDAYLQEPGIAMEDDPLMYWKQKQSMWPLLETLARKYLAIPPASVTSGQLFSIAADIVTDKRNRLNADKVEMLLF